MRDQLIARLKSYIPDADPALIERAWDIALRAHAGQKRVSGEDYFTHCAAVALILADLKADAATIASALLHDVLEDTSVKSAELSAAFGPEIAGMVEGVTKIGAYRFSDPELEQAENWRKMLIAVTRDIRVILIKLADRIHNLRTIQYLAPERQQKIAAESLHLYAPFAQRLGMYRLKGEIEDLSFKTLHPADYASLYEQWMRRQESSAHALGLLENLLTEALTPTGIPFRISARPKSLYGVYRKMQRQHTDLSCIQDLLGLRIITDTLEHCYGLLGIIDTRFVQVAGSFTDYIRLPKVNGYQSLHQTITGPGGLQAEIQIRTEEMHRAAEYGIAAHWRYKEGQGKKPAGTRPASDGIEQRLDWLREILEDHPGVGNSFDLIAAFRLECDFEQIYVFTPRGKVIRLPNGATPLDFAYAVHTEIGHHCYGARVGGKMVPLNSKLASGDICDIMIRRNNKPSKHWLEFAVTAGARSKIRKFLRLAGENI